VKFITATSGGDSLMIDNGTGIGIGTAPSYPLHVTSAAVGTGVFFNTAAANDTLYAQNTAAAGTNTGAGVVGYTAQANPSAAGVFGQNLSANGTGTIGYGNNVLGFTLLAGSGGSFTGSNTGVYAKSTVATVGATNSEAMYTETGTGPNVVRVNAWNGGVLYKIVGTGMVSTVVRDPTHPSQSIVLHAPETPEVYFSDFGTGQLHNGRAHVQLDPRFSGNVTIDTKHPMRVFVQLESDESAHGVVVTNKTATGFDVVELEHGRSNATFQWQVTANRADEVLAGGQVSHNADIRFEPAPAPHPAAKATRRALTGTVTSSHE
jgi:hypothetical protein